jgi:hypothetical protein
MRSERFTGRGSVPRKGIAVSDAEPTDVTGEELGQLSAVLVRAAFVDLAAGDDEGAAEKLAETDSALIDAFIAQADGTSDMLARSGDRAAKHFAEAADGFDKAAEECPPFARPIAVYADNVRVMQAVATGVERQYRFDFAGAASALIEAVARLQDLAHNRLPAFASEEDDDDARSVLQRLQHDIDTQLPGVQAAASEAAYQSAMVRGDPTAAYSAAQETVERLDVYTAGLAAAPMNERAMAEMALAKANVDLAMAEALTMRASQQWDGAFAAYDRARDFLRKASLAAAGSQLENAQAMQDSFISYAASGVDPAARECSAERTLRDELAAARAELDRFRDAVLAHASAQPVIQQIVTQTQQQTQAQEQQQAQEQVQQQVVQEARAELRDLVPALIASQLPERDELAREASELAEDPSEGKSFLEKAVGFTKKISEIVKNAEEVAGPVVPIVKTLVKLLPVAAVVL